MPARCSLRVRSVIGMPGSPNTVSMPLSFSASMTRLKPSVSSTGCGCGGADWAGAVFCSLAVTASITFLHFAKRGQCGFQSETYTDPVFLLADQARAARPLVLRAEHHHRRLGGVGIRRDTVVEQELR